MLKTDYLDEYSLGIIRQRHLNLDEDDNSKDDEINEMSQEDIAACLTGWELGSDQWLDDILENVSTATGLDIDKIKDRIFIDN